MNNFREDDQIGNNAMQAFWKSPIGKEWIKEQKVISDKMTTHSKANGMLLPVSDTITKLIFENER